MEDLQKVKEKKSHSFRIISELFDGNQVGRWSLDINKNEYTYISKGIEMITGYSKDYFTKISWDTLIHPDDFIEYQERQHQLLKGIEMDCKYRIIHRYGEVKFVKDFTKPVFDNHGKFIRMDCVITDITKQELMKK